MSPYNKEASKRYYEKNKEKIAERSKQRHLINREENLRKMRERYKQKKGSTKQSLESISLPGEIWKSVVVDGKYIHGILFLLWVELLRILAVKQ